jgi:hypothetical protein
MVADAITYYVATNGSDSNSGTQTQPFRTIQKAANIVKPGDTVMVMPGIYSQSVANERHGTASARIRFVSQTKWGAKLHSSGRIIFSNAGNYVDIDGFDIKGVGGIAPLNKPSQLAIANYGSHVNILRNNVHDIKVHHCDTPSGIGGNAILTGTHARPATNINVIANVVHDNGSAAAACPTGGRGPHGIYHVHDGIVANNIVYNNRGVGIHLWHEPHHVLVAHNLVFNNGTSGILVGGQEGPAHHIRVVNNIVIDNQGNGLREAGKNGTTNQFINNIVFRNRRGNVSLSVATNQGTIVADPQFINYQINGSGDYRLKSNSPAIRAGITLPQIPCDFNGHSRLAGSAYDLGVYAYNSTPSSNCTSSPPSLAAPILRMVTP